MLALRRDGADAALICSLLESSARIDTELIRPDGLLRTPLRWPADPRAVPLALCIVVHDRPCAVAAVRQLVHHVGDVAVVAVVDDAVDDADDDGIGVGALTTALLAAGVDDVVGADGLTGPVLEQVVVAAIDRRDRGVLHLGEPSEILVARPHHQAV